MKNILLISFIVVMVGCQSTTNKITYERVDPESMYWKPDTCSNYSIPVYAENENLENENIVYIGGELKKPGHYRINKVTTLTNLINSAGGLNPFAVRIYIQNKEKQKKAEVYREQFVNKSCEKYKINSGDFIFVFTTD